MDALRAVEIEPPSAARQIVRQQRAVELGIGNPETKFLIEARLRDVQAGFPVLPAVRPGHLRAYAEIRQRPLLRDRRRKVVERVTAWIVIDGVVTVKRIHA